MLSMATSTLSFQHLLLPTLSSRIRIKSGVIVLNPFKASNALESSMKELSQKNASLLKLTKTLQSETLAKMVYIAK